MCPSGSFPDFGDLPEQERERLLEKARLETRLSAIRHWERAANTSVVDLADMVLAWWREAKYMDGPVGNAFDETPDFVHVAGNVVAYALLSTYDGTDPLPALTERLKSLGSGVAERLVREWQVYQEALEAMSCK